MTLDVKSIKMSDIKKLKSEIRMLCPYCGEWHSLKRENDLFKMKCPTWDTKSEVEVKFLEESNEVFAMITMDYPCIFVKKFKEDIKIPLQDFDQQYDPNGIKITALTEITTFRMALYSDDLLTHEVNRMENREQIIENCWFGAFTNEHCRECIIQKHKKASNSMHMPIEMLLEFDEKNAETKQEEKKMEANKMSKMLPVDINKMAEDLGINFGLNTDERIKSTILGTVVEYEDGKLRGFDRKKKEMVNYANLATVYLPSILIPSTTVKVGDTIIHNGEPFFIEKAKVGDVWGANPLTSKEEKLLPIANPLGVKTYTRLISIGEIMGFKGDNPQNTKIFLWLLTMVANKVFSEGVDSANEKIRQATARGSKYIETLAPFAFVAFAAYAMKGEDMRMGDLAKTAKDNFGVELDCLKDKKVLKRIAAIGLATTAAVTYFNSTVKKAASEDTPTDCNEEEVTKGLDKLLKAIKPWESTIQKVLPAAIAICAVKLFSGSNIEGIKDKLEGCVLIAQDKFCDKLGLDEDFFSKENLKKFGLLLGIAITTFMVYGKKLDSKDKNAETANGMIKQIIPVIAPLIPAVVIFAPELKNFFKKYKESKDDDFDFDFDDIHDEIPVLDDFDESETTEMTEESESSEETEITEEASESEADEGTEKSSDSEK